MMKQIKAMVITAGVAFVGLITFANSNETTTSTTTVALPMTPTTLRVALQPVISTTTSTTTSTSTTTEVPLVSDPLDYIDEQRMLHGRCGEWHDLAIEVGWQESEWEILSNVIYRESRCTPDAWNGSDAGLTQINKIHTAWLADMGWSHPEDMFDAKANLLFALRLWETSGWRPWKATSGQ